MASSRSWVTRSTLIPSRSTSATTSLTTRARTIASSEANGSSMRMSLGFLASSVAHDEAHPFEDRLRAVGNGKITNAQRSTSGDRNIVQPGHARTGLDEAAGDQALLDPLGRVEIDAHGFRVERIPVARDDVAELLEVEAGGHLLRESGSQLIAGHAAQRL